jgi:hypothetical protein
MILVFLLDLYYCHILLYLPFYRLDINLILAPTHHLYIGNRRVLFTIKYRIDLLYGFALSLHPIVPLLILVMRRRCGKKAHNKAQDYNIPRCVDHIHLPADIIEADWHDEYEHEPVKVSQENTRFKKVVTYARAFREKDVAA